MAGFGIGVQILNDKDMKKSLYIICVALLAFMSAFQTVTATGLPEWRKTFCFAYIAHDGLTSVDKLEKYLQARYDRAVSREDYVFVAYLAYEDTPMIVQVNTPGDNREQFSSLLDELRNGWEHKVNPEYDIRRIVDLVEELDFVKPGTDEIMYGAVDWHFHVTSDFWKKGYNESVIASLCFVLGVEHFETDNFRMRCYFSRNDDFVYDEEAPFGEKDFCNLEFMPYYY